MSCLCREVYKFGQVALSMFIIQVHRVFRSSNHGDFSRKNLFLPTLNLLFGFHFLASISLSKDGSCVAIGAPYNDQNGANSGEVRVFRFSSGLWVQVGSTWWLSLCDF